MMISDLSLDLLCGGQYSIWQPLTSNARFSPLDRAQRWLNNRYFLQQSPPNWQVRYGPSIDTPKDQSQHLHKRMRVIHSAQNCTFSNASGRVKSSWFSNLSKVELEITWTELCAPEAAMPLPLGAKNNLVVTPSVCQSFKQDFIFLGPADELLLKLNFSIILEVVSCFLGHFHLALDLGSAEESEEDKSSKDEVGEIKPSSLLSHAGLLVDTVIILDLDLPRRLIRGRKSLWASWTFP